MQNLPIYLYPNTLTVILDLDTTTQGVNQVMYQRDLKVQKGIKNQIQIQFRNSDQKKINISNSQTFVFSMFDAVNQRLMITKALEVLDTGTVTTRGLALLTLTESDTMDLDRSSYQYSVKLLDADGSYTSAYANTYYDVAGTLHLKADTYPVSTDSTAIATFDPVWNDQIQMYEYRSGNIYASPQFNGNTALHTAAVYSSAYKGTVYIDATMDNTPGASSNYSVVQTLTYNGVSGIRYVNFNGVFSYVRFRHVPAKGPVAANNADTAFSGTLDKILYRS